MVKSKLVEKKPIAIIKKRKIRYLRKILKKQVKEGKIVHESHYETKPNTNEDVKIPSLTKFEKKIKEENKSCFENYQKNMINFYKSEQINFLQKSQKKLIQKLHEKELNISYTNSSQFFNKKDRLEAILIITNLFHKFEKCENPLILGKKILFEVLRLFDFILSKINKEIEHDEVIYLIFSSLFIVSKSELLPNLSCIEFYKECLHDFDINVMLNDQALILLYCKGDIYPIKSIDYFPIIMSDFKRLNQNDKKFSDFFQIFEKTYYEVNYMILFDYEVSLKIPSVVFVISMYTTIDSIKNKNGDFDKYCYSIQIIIKDLMNELNYPQYEYTNTELTIGKACDKYNEIILNL